MDLRLKLPSSPLRQRFSPILYLGFLCVLIAFSQPQAQNLSFTPIMPRVVTNLMPSDLDVFTSSGFSGNQVFVVAVDNLGSTLTTANLRLHYRVRLQRGGGASELIYECLSNVFDLSPGEVVPPLSSSEFFNGTSINKIYKEIVVFEMSSSQLLNVVAATQRVPDAEITQEMILESGGAALVTQSVKHTILNATSIDLVSPGSQGSESAVIFEQNPLFVWTSDLPSHIYQSGAVFEVQLFEAYGSEPAGEATSRIPIFSARTTTSSFRYPTTARRLAAGKRYFWRVVGFLKGFTNATITSAPLGFTFEEQLDPEVDEVLKILQLVCTEEELAVVKRYRASVMLKGEGGALSKDELRSLVAKITSGQLEKRGVHTQ